MGWKTANRLIEFVGLLPVLAVVCVVFLLDSRVFQEEEP